jgi:hypothetical protein
MSLQPWLDALGAELAAAPARRRRRRAGRTALVAAVVVAAVVAGVGLLTGGAPEREVPATPPPMEVAPRTLLQRTYMGVACPVPNDLSCDRVGLYVRLRAPARAVTATIGGRRFRLDDPHFGDGRVPRRDFAGYLRHAGLVGDGPLAVHAPTGGGWMGYAPTPRVTLEVTRADGTRVRTVKRIGLAPGWG